MKRVRDLQRMRDKSAMWRDPDRWEDADMQRNDWVRRSAGLLLLAVFITVVTIAVGIALS